MSRRRGVDVRRSILRHLDDREDGHVQQLADAVGLGRAMTGCYLNELTAEGFLLPMAGPKARSRRYRRAAPLA